MPVGGVANYLDDAGIDDAADIGLQLHPAFPRDPAPVAKDGEAPSQLVSCFVPLMLGNDDL